MSEEQTPYLTRADQNHDFNTSFSDRYFLGEMVDRKMRDMQKEIGAKACGMNFLAALYTLGYRVVLKGGSQ